MKAAGKNPNSDRWKAKYKEPVAANTAALPQLPEGWCWATVEELSQLVRNGCSKKPAVTGDVQVLRISAVRPMAIDPSDYKWLSGTAEDYAPDLVQPGDLLFTRYSGTPALVGVSALVRNLDQPMVHPDKLIKVRFVDAANLDLAYLELATNTGRSRGFIGGRVRTTAGQTGISGSDIKQVPIPLPPGDEQQRISRAVGRFLDIERAVEQTVAKTVGEVVRVRQCLLRLAFDGKLVDHAANVGPASIS